MIASDLGRIAFDLGRIALDYLGGIALDFDGIAPGFLDEVASKQEDSPETELEGNPAQADPP